MRNLSTESMLPPLATNRMSFALVGGWFAVGSKPTCEHFLFDLSSGNLLEYYSCLGFICTQGDAVDIKEHYCQKERDAFVAVDERGVLGDPECVRGCKIKEASVTVIGKQIARPGEC